MYLGMNLKIFATPLKTGRWHLMTGSFLLFLPHTGQRLQEPGPAVLSLPGGDSVRHCALPIYPLYPGARFAFLTNTHRSKHLGFTFPASLIGSELPKARACRIYSPNPSLGAQNTWLSATSVSGNSRGQPQRPRPCAAERGRSFSAQPPPARPPPARPPPPPRARDPP